MPLETKLKSPIVANDVPRNNPYFAFPAEYRTVPVINETTGKAVDVRFRFSGFSAYNAKNIGQHDWNNGSFVYAPSPCQSGGYGVSAGEPWYAFIWRIPESNGACYKISKIDRTEPSHFYDMSISYDLKTPDPLKMESGIYKGKLSLKVGPGGDIDFGDIYEANDNILNINFTLTVTHELKLTPSVGSQTITLQPCMAGKICSENEGKTNWQRWMVTRITPQLTGRSGFTLSSSGGFTVYLDCAEKVGAECALESDASQQKVPVQVMLNLPDNVVDENTGLAVTHRLLHTSKSLEQNRFTAKSYGAEKTGSIDFLVRQRDVHTMLATRPDKYRGTITVIFDPEIY